MKIEFTKNRTTIRFGEVKAGDTETGSKEDLQPFVDNGVAKIVKAGEVKGGTDGS